MDTNEQKNTPLSELLGIGTIFGSALCFYFATVLIRFGQVASPMPAENYVFIRFLLGAIVVCSIFAIQKRKPVVNEWKFLLLRAVTNLAAVYCFFQSVTHGSVAIANILNMTYPVWIALITLLFIPSQRDVVSAFLALIAFVGIYLVINPSGATVGPGVYWGIGSGSIASLAILSLNLTRQKNDVDTVLFYMFVLGTVFSLLAFYPRLHLSAYNSEQIYYLVTASSLGVVGQFLLTFGFKFVTAVEGGIIGSTRILIAALAGPFIVGESSLGLYGFVGAVIIFLVNTAVTVRKFSKNRKTKNITAI